MGKVATSEAKSSIPLHLGSNITLLPTQNSTNGSITKEMATYILLFFGISFFKSQSIFLDPRLWAEEGSNFYQNCVASSTLYCLTRTFMGSYLILTNTITYLSTLVPVLYAPLVTTYLTLLLHLALVAQIVVFSRAYALSRVTTALLVSAIALLPAMSEVWMTSTNVQWLTGVSVLWLFVMPTGWLEQHWKGAAFWSAICGLSGIPAAIMTPLFVARGIIDRSRAILLIGAVLAACTIFQAVILAETPMSHYRSFPTNLLTLVGPLLLQTVLAPLFSPDFATALGQAAGTERVVAGTALWGTAIVGFGVVVLIVKAAWSRVPTCLLILTLVAWVFVTLVQIFGGLGSEWFLSGLGGSRYFLFGSMCLCIVLAWATLAEIKMLKSAAMGLLSVAVLSGALAAAFSPALYSRFTGPSWRQQIDSCPPAKSCHVVIWPGKPWGVDIVK